MTIKPLRNRLLVERLPERKPENGVLIPEAYEESLRRGDTGVYRVLAVGPGKRNHKGILIHLEMTPGDIIIATNNYGATEPFHDGRILMDDSEVLAVIPKQ